MSDLSVSERRIRPIQDAVSAGNWKQALSLCDKWQKKGEKSDRFLALKASILVNQPDKSQVEKGKTEVLQLCRRNVPITDVEALYNLQDTLKRLSLQNEEGPKLWDRAAAALPDDKDFLTTWLNGSLSDGNWLMAQKASMALRKAFPKERQYDFLNILSCYLVHQDATLSEKERVLFGTLAFRLVSKAAEAVPTNKTAILSPGKAISTPDELALLVSIYQATGHVDEAVTLLQNASLGLESKIAEADPQMVFSLLLEVLDSSTKSDTVLQACQKILATDAPKSHDRAEDDRIWRTVARTALSTESELRRSCLELIEAILRRMPGCRAAHLAKLEVLTQTAPDDRKPNEDLQNACQAYYDNFHLKPFCFADLVKPLRSSSADYIQRFINYTNPEETADAREVFRLKLEYSMLSEQTSNEEDFIAFAAKAVKLHKVLPKHKTECPEALVLAALSLLRLASRTQNTVYAVQASFMLEYTSSKFNDYYPSAIRMLQAHRVLGLLSLAMETFVTLSVKNIQWETVGHLILTRISSIHPMQSGHGENSLNPLGAFDAGLSMLAKAERSLNQAIQQGLEYGSYANVLDSVKVKNDIENSLNRQIFTVEERKIHSLIGIPVDIVLEPRPTKVVDTRDSDFLDNCGVTDEALQKYLRCGPSPDVFWLDTMILCDHLATGLKLELAGLNVASVQAFEALNHCSDKLNISEESRASLTDAEYASLTCHLLISKVIKIARNPLPSKDSSADDILDQIKSWLQTPEHAGIANINGIEVPTWKYLHGCFSRLETIQNVALLLSFLSRKSKSGKSGKNTQISKEKITNMQKSVADAAEAIYVRTKQLKESINAPGVLGKLVDVAAGRVEDEQLDKIDAYRHLGAELEDPYDEVALEEYCGRIRESWEDALDGVIQTKIKTTK